MRTSASATFKKKIFIEGTTTRWKIILYCHVYTPYKKKLLKIFELPNNCIWSTQVADFCQLDAPRHSEPSEPVVRAHPLLLLYAPRWLNTKYKQRVWRRTLKNLIKNIYIKWFGQYSLIYVQIKAIHQQIRFYHFKTRVILNQTYFLCEIYD